jgi:type IV pilus assembly protein PilO
MELEDLPWYGQFLVFLLLGAVLLAFFYFLHYKGKAEEIERMENQLEKVELEIAKAQRKINQLRRIEKEIELKQAQLQQLKEILPEKKQIETILQKTVSIISNARLEMDSIKFPTPRRRDVVLMEVPITVKLRGSFHNLGSFFDQLSKQKKIFTVGSLRITPRRNANKGFTISADFNASTYYLIKQKTTVK